MFRKAAIVLACVLLAACSPRLIPKPVTPGPTTAPPTPTVAAIDAPVIAQPNLTSIHMLDENNGWGVSDTSVLRTNDGGNTWYDIGPKNAGQLGFAVTTAFLDEQHAWVLSPDPNDMLKGALLITSDGGKTWQSVAAPFGGGDLHMLDAKNGWMMASLGAAAGSMGVAVYQTHDGGASWVQAFTNDPNVPNAGSSLPLGGLKDGLAAVNMQTAWIGGVTYAPGIVYLYRTDDGGATWQQVSVKPPEGYDQAEIETRGPVFLNANTAYLPVTVSSQNGVMLAVYVSQDGGNTWRVSPTMIPQGGAMDFVSPQDGFVWNATSFYVTHDGAQSWATVNPDVAFGPNFSGMDWVSPSTGWVTTADGSGGFGLYKSTDGGLTWNVLGK